jgi:hypothetical protein
VKVFNIAGESVYASSSNTIDISDKPNGCYFVEIQTKTDARVFKIIKQ